MRQSPASAPDSSIMHSPIEAIPVAVIGKYLPTGAIEPCDARQGGWLPDRSRNRIARPSFSFSHGQSHLMNPRLKVVVAAAVAIVVAAVLVIWVSMPGEPPADLDVARAKA